MTAEFTATITSITDAPGRHVRGWARFVLADARSEGVGERFARPLFWLPVAGLLVTAVTYAYPPLFYLLLRDDRVYEWGQFALCLGTLALAVAAARYRIRQHWWPAAAFLLAVAFGTLLLAGEEISWGQRVFGLTSAGLESVNRQGETNLHNISAEGLEIESIFRVVQAAIALFAVVAPFVVRRRPARSRGGELLRVITPPAFLAPAFLMILSYRVLRFLLPGLTDVTPVKKLQEFAELSLYAALAVMVGLLFLHARAAGSHPAPSGGHRASDGRRVTRADLLSLVPLVVVVLVLTAVLAVATGLSPVVVDS